MTSSWLHLLKDWSLLKTRGGSAIGDYVIYKLKKDKKLIDQLNGDHTPYGEKDKEKCPIHAGIKLFEIMLHQGIHTGFQDHMWMFYFKHFLRSMLESIEHTAKSGDHEYQSPFHFLINEMVTISINWSLEAAYIDQDQLKQNNRSNENYDPSFISKNAMNLTREMFFEVMKSTKINDHFKTDLLFGFLVKIHSLKDEARIMKARKIEKESPLERVMNFEGKA